MSSTPTGVPEDPAAPERRRRRRAVPPPETLEAQLAWLDDQQKPMKSGRTRAEADARRLASKFRSAATDAEIEDLSLTASQRAIGRVRRKLERDGAIPVVGSGLRGYFRQTLRREVDRGLAELARRRAAQLAPDESTTVTTDIDQRLPVPHSEVRALLLSVRGWAHRYHQHHIDAAEAQLHHASLEFSSGSARMGLRLAGTSLPTVQDWSVPATGPSVSVRVENRSTVALHVAIALIGWQGADGVQMLRLPVALFDTRRGIGWSDATAAGAVAQRRQPATPRRVALRQISPCEYSKCNAAVAARSVEDQLAGLAGPVTQAVSLSLHAAPQVGAGVWAEVVRDRSPEEGAELMCRLAEWASPGLHPPHRQGHPGGHPLAAEIAAAVDRVPAPAGVAPNTLHQRRRRLRSRVQQLVAGAAQAAHDVIREV